MILHRALACALFVSFVCCSWPDAPVSGVFEAGVDAKPASDAGAGATFDAGVTDARSGDASEPADSGGDAGTGARCGVSGRDDCGPFRLCDHALGCVDCLLDDDCPLSARHCVFGVCVACRTDLDAGVDDCPASAPSCWPGDHACHARCADDAGCPTDAPVCLASGACVGCTADAECAGGVCSAVTRQCVQCQADADCSGDAPRCDAARGICVQCTYDADCGVHAPICDPGTRRCREGCFTDAQCPGGRCDAASATCAPNDAGAVSDAGAEGG